MGCRVERWRGEGGEGVVLVPVETLCGDGGGEGDGGEGGEGGEGEIG